MTKEHYKNHPNDKPLDSVGMTLMSKVGKLMHKLKLHSIHFHIAVGLLKTQIKADSQIKKVFIEMYPNEYRLALMEAMDRYGPTKKKEIRREEIIKTLNVKDPYLLKKIFKGYQVKDDTAV